jgi:hypothetical protein
VFHLSGKPSISFEEYLQRLAKYSRCSKACLQMSVALLARLQRAGQEVNRRTIFKLLAGCLVLSIKFY